MLIPLLASAGISVLAVIELAEKSPDLLFILLVVLVIVLAIALKNKINPLFWAGIGVGGAIVETACIQLSNGTWEYKKPELFNSIPKWLIPLWAIAGGLVIGIHNVLS